MANFFKDTITLFLFDKSTQSFNQYVIKNVYFRHAIATRMTEEGLIRVSSGSITIPIEYAEIGELNLEELTSKNSYVVEGEVSDMSYVAKMTYNDLVKNYHLFRITSVADNRKGGLQHFKLEVEE